MHRVPGFAWLALLLAACGQSGDPQAGVAMTYAYASPLVPSCTTEPALAASAASGRRISDPRFSYLVRTPTNFDARWAHPLLVVYAAAGMSAEQTERLTGLTAVATGHGFVVAYVDHRPMSRRNVVALGGVVQSVVERWCIDPQRVFVAGHSDGATVSTALSLLPDSQAGIHGIAVSASGFRREDLKELGCRAPVPVMVMHGAKDSLFPGWGRDAAHWWAGCNGCKEPIAQPDADGCVNYRECAAGASVVYCEGPRSHTEWPGLQARMVDFLLAAGPVESAQPELPPIRIVSPAPGARVGPDLAVEFETDADLPNMTMDAPSIGIHLHVDIDGEVMMPAMEDLVLVGPQRYRYRFDLPAHAGPHTIGVFWSDASHKTIDSTVRRVSVTVVPEPRKAMP